MALAPFLESGGDRKYVKFSIFTQEKELSYMRLSHILIAGATAVSFSAIAAGEQKEQPQAQSSQSQSASGGATQSQAGQQASQSQETVKQVQQQLSQSGQQLEVDGIMGPQTQAALKEFQEKKGLQATGELNQETMAALGISEGASASTGSSAGQSSSGGASQDNSSSSQGGAGGSPSGSGSSSGSGSEKKY